MKSSVAQISVFLFQFRNPLKGNLLGFTGFSFTVLEEAITDVRQSSSQKNSQDDTCSESLVVRLLHRLIFFDNCIGIKWVEFSDHYRKVSFEETNYHQNFVQTKNYGVT
jgi:hypothetical protein